MLSNRELKKNARAQLGGNIFANDWLMMLVCCLIVSVISSAASMLLLIGFLIVWGPMQFGLARVTIDRARGKKGIEVGDLFKGFSENFGATCVLGIMVSIFTFLWCLLFIVPGIVKSYSYSMAFYIQQDNPEKDWKECINESKSMMNGKKGQLFLLDLSFIGWMLLGALCCGIGILFVNPYMSMSRANFYLSLKGEENSDYTASTENEYTAGSPDSSENQNSNDQTEFL